MVQQRMKSFTLLVLIVFILLVLFAAAQSSQKEENVEYSDFWKALETGKVFEIKISDHELRWRKEDLNKVFVAQAILDQGDIKLLREAKLNLTKNPPDPHIKEKLDHPILKFDYHPENPWWLALLQSWVPFVFLIAVWFYLVQKMQGGGAKALSFGKSRARLVESTKTNTTFDDVAGCDEAKGELQEIIEFLKFPKKFVEIGARIPRGVLLVGPPGTGKTLLARAVAGEAKVPFLHISGSDFVEMFVGVGASRVRDLFEQGKKNAPCLLFIDEIDAVGRQRGAGLGGGHDEREQTLNQLLVEMDGFDSNEGIIMIAATNRPDVLDPALLRPGRFDRQIVVDLPDIKGREQIFKIHARRLPLDRSVDYVVLARATPGFSGADIANMVNEAALLAARRDRKIVRMDDFEESRDKVIMGPERKSRILTEPVRVRTAYHEAGHALVSTLVGSPDPVHKISIIPRGRALGVTSFLPEESQMYIRERKYLLNAVCGLMGGRVAEELKFNEISSGAANDIEKATKIVRQMVCEFGMSDRLGPITYGESHSLVFLGRDITRERNYSEQTARDIDEEVNRTIRECYDLTRQLLTENFAKLELLSQALLIHEVLDGSQMERVLRGEQLPAPTSPRGTSAPATPGSKEEPQVDGDPAPVIV